MEHFISSAELEAYLDEALPSERMACIEQAMRDDPQLVTQLADSIGRRDAGVHSLGAIWRRHRLSCPTREQLGSYLLEVLAPGQADYVRFHLDSIGCRYCTSSLEDLRTQHAATDADQSASRRQKFYQTSAGYLSKNS